MSAKLGFISVAVYCMFTEIILQTLPIGLPYGHYFQLQMSPPQIKEIVYNFLKW